VILFSLAVDVCSGLRKQETVWKTADPSHVFIPTRLKHDWMDKIVPGPLLARLTVSDGQGHGAYWWSASVAVGIDYRPDDALPPTIPVIGFGAGLPNGVHLSWPLPQTPSTSAYRIGMGCAWAVTAGARACTLREYTTYMHALRSSSPGHTQSDSSPSLEASRVCMEGAVGCSANADGELDAFEGNDVVRIALRSAKAKAYMLSGARSMAAVPFDSDATAASKRQQARALRNRVAQSVGVDVDALMRSSRATGGPKPIPPIGSRFDLGLLLEAEGKRVGVEVGVQHATFSEALAVTWPSLSVLFLVDPWLHLASEDNYIDSANVAQSKQDAILSVCSCVYCL
jgi:hypothetical protein